MGFKLSDINLDRSVYLFDQFQQETAEEITKSLLLLDSKATEDIYLIINSYGGQVYALMSILDTISNIKSNVNTVCLGIGASCGAILFSMGKKRYIGENSKLMFHQVSTFAYGTVDQVENDLEEAKSLNDKIFNMLLERSGMDKDNLEKLFSKDSYVDAEKAISSGFADGIIELDTEEQSEAYEMVKNFVGAMKDEAYFAIVASKFSNSRLQPVKYNKKGEKHMDLEEIKQELLNKHQIDVDNLLNDITQLKTNLTDMEAKLAEKTAELDKINADKLAFEAKVKEDKLNSILDKLISDGKSTQVLNADYKEMFSAMEFDRIEKFCANLPVIVKLDRQSEHVPEDTSNLTDEEKRVESIKAFALENKISFTDAAIQLMNKKGE